MVTWLPVGGVNDVPRCDVLIAEIGRSKPSGRPTKTPSLRHSESGAGEFWPAKSAAKAESDDADPDQNVATAVIRRNAEDLPC